MRAGKFVGAITLALFGFFLKSYYMQHLGIDPAKAQRDFDAVATQLSNQHGDDSPFDREERDEENEKDKPGQIQTNPYLKD